MCVCVLRGEMKILGEVPPGWYAADPREISVCEPVWVWVCVWVRVPCVWVGSFPGKSGGREMGIYPFISPLPRCKLLFRLWPVTRCVGAVLEGGGGMG